MRQMTSTGWRLDWDDVSHVERARLNWFLALWDNLCTVNTAPRARGSTRYVLWFRIRVALMTVASIVTRCAHRHQLGSPRFYGLGDMAAYVNFASNQATFNLAEVPEVHAGKELVIELWDPDSGNSAVRIERPDGTLPNCSWNATDGSGTGGALIPCNITGYGPQQFNDHHMQIRIAIPNTYSCTADCWWTIEVTYATAARTTPRRGQPYRRQPGKARRVAGANSSRHSATVRMTPFKQGKALPLIAYREWDSNPHELSPSGFWMTVASIVTRCAHRHPREVRGSTAWATWLRT